MRRALLLLLLSLAGCGQSAPVGNRAAANEEAPDVVKPEPVPVRVGELGPSFIACPAGGTTRHVAAGESLPVRAAPFDNAAEVASLPSGARFFVCTRTLDQKWFGIVFEPGGGLAARCGVSGPAPARRSYSGPCGSGWVASASVKLTAEEGEEAPPVANQAAPPASAGA